ncbi:MAG: hypothetical protein ABI462_07365 [Ignavibacteria bacterium]
MKKIILLICFIVTASSTFAQIRLYENFDYPVGDSIGAHGWNWNTGVVNTIFVSSPGLSYAGYPLSDIGSSARIRNNGNDAYKNFPADSTGVLYASFMVTVDSIKTAGDYFVALISPTSTSNYVARFWARDTAGALSFGLSKTTVGNGGIFYTPGLYSLGTTYTVVIKYTFNPGIADDQMSAFIFSSGIPATEPGSATIGPVTGTANDAPIGRFAVRQGSTASSPTLNIDGIRVSDNWFGNYLQVKFAIQGLAVASITTTDTMQISLRNIASPHAIVDQSISNVGLFSGVGTGAFEFFTAAPGSYFVVGSWRNNPSFKNGINTWSAAGVPLVSGSGTVYDFTSAASKAFGNNQKLIGTVYTMYNGDPIQDGTINLADILAISNDITAFAIGYRNTDINGDLVTTLPDLLISFNNGAGFVHQISPP